MLKHVLPGLFISLLISGCSYLDTLPYTPTQTVETWLRIQPWVELRILGHSLILVQPSTSAIVYLLGLVKPAEAEAVVDTAKYVSGVQQVVKLFEYIQ